MTRKSKPLITGGLLGLAGLGLLPQAAEANTSLPVAVPEPDLGATLAKDPHPVVVPEPSAQPTAPQTEDQGVAQPTWTPESDSPVAAAAAAAPSPQPEPTAVDMAAPESSTPVDAAVPETKAVLPAPAAIAPIAAPALAPEPSEPEFAALESPAPASSKLEPSEPAFLAPEPSAPEPSENRAIELSSAPVPVPATDPGPIEDAAVSTATEAIAVTEATEAIASPPVAAAAIASPAKPSTAIAPAPAPAAGIRPAPAARPTTARQTAPDVATLRSRAATVQALLHDLRSAYGIEAPLTDATATPTAPLRQVSRPEVLQRGPQLPPLPSRSAHRSPVMPPQPVAIAGPVPAVNAVQISPLAGPTPNVALALPTPQPVMSSRRAVHLSPEPTKLPSQSAALPAGVTTAQATPSTTEADQVRDDLRIEPLTTAAEPAQSFPPSPNAGIPSAFGAEWGDVFFSASLSGADRLRAEADGSLSMGFGLGDARRAVGVELAYNLQSIRQFGENGGFDAKVHRQVYSGDTTQVAAAVGVNNFVSYGSNAAGTSASVYGVVTAAHLLQPEHPVNRMPITATLGAGSGYFSGDNSDVGVIAGVGLQVHPQFSINTAWSGAGLNVGASIVPEPTVPLTLNLLYGDIGNNTRAGSVAVLSIGYGFNFGPRF